LTRFTPLAALALVLVGCSVDEERTASSTVAASFDFAAATGGDGTTWWAAPWPSDARVDADGTPDLDGFPNPEGSELFATYLAFGEAEATGFSLSSPIYFDLTAPSLLPEWDEDAAATSADCLGPVRIVDVDPSSPEYGECRPVQWSVIPSNSTDPFVDPDLVIVHPAWGFPLLAETTYAAYLVDLEASDGFVEGPESLQAALAGDTTESWATSYGPLAAHLADQPDTDLRWIATGTVFTTHDPTAGMAIAAEYVKADTEYPRWLDAEPLADVEEGHDQYHSDYRMITGAYEAWNFQRGEIPYAEEGGGFVFEGGAIVPQAVERIPFVIGMPDERYEQPEGGWPIVLHSHGTGGDEWSHIGRGGLLRPGLQASNRGFVSMGIPQPIHSDRWPEGNGLALSLNSFNFFNPESGSSMFRQGALDLISQVQFVLRFLTGDGAIAAAAPELRIDPDQIYFMGHSQGGLTGSLALPFDEHIRAFALSGAGGGLPMTVMQREDPLVIRDVLVTQLGDPPGLVLSDVHPAVGLVGWLAERTDPLAHAPLWNRRAERPPASILLFEGIHDEQTPASTSEALAVAAGLPVARPYREQVPFGLELRGLEPLRTPYSGNGAAPDGTPVTLGLAQFDDDHFAVFNDANAASLWADLFKDMARNGGPGVLGEE